MSFALGRRLAGVTLEQFAGVSAAVMEGFALADALANEGVARSTWSRASVGWNRKLAAAGGEAPLSVQFRALLGQAQDWLGGRLLPVDDDPGAWLDLLAALAGSPDPTPVLAGLGVEARDVARSQRRWTERMAEDEGIRKHVAALAREERKPISAITVVPPQLKPFPWTRVMAAPRRGVGVAVSDGAQDPGLALDQYAALKAELSVRPEERARILAGYGLDGDGLERLEVAWSERFAAEPAAARDFRLLASLCEVRFRAAAGEGQPATQGASAVRLESSQAVGELGGPAGVGPNRTPMSGSQRLGAAASRLGATGDISWAALGVAALPFVQGGSAVRRAEREGGYAVAATATAGGATRSATEAALGGAAVRVGETAELTPEMLAVVLRRVHAPHFLAGGAERADAGREPDGRTASASTRGPAQEEGMPVPVPGAMRGPVTAQKVRAPHSPPGVKPRAAGPPATVAVSHASLGAAPLPFAAGRTPTREAPTSGTSAVAAAVTSGDAASMRGETKDVSIADLRTPAAAVPFGAATARKRAPDLTLEQYASYCAEMVAAPSEFPRILEQYGIASPAARVALSVHWGKRFEADPELKARFEVLQDQYVAWLRAKRGERR